MRYGVQCANGNRLLFDQEYPTLSAAAAAGEDYDSASVIVTCCPHLIVEYPDGD